MAIPTSIDDIKVENKNSRLINIIRQIVILTKWKLSYGAHAMERGIFEKPKYMSNGTVEDIQNEILNKYRFVIYIIVPVLIKLHSFNDMSECLTGLLHDRYIRSDIELSSYIKEQLLVEGLNTILDSQIVSEPMIHKPNAIRIDNDEDAAPAEKPKAPIDLLDELVSDVNVKEVERSDWNISAESNVKSTESNIQSDLFTSLIDDEKSNRLEMGYIDISTKRSNSSIDGEPLPILSLDDNTDGMKSASIEEDINLRNTDKTQNNNAMASVSKTVDLLDMEDHVEDHVVNQDKKVSQSMDILGTTLMHESKKDTIDIMGSLDGHLGFNTINNSNANISNSNISNSNISDITKSRDLLEENDEDNDGDYEAKKNVTTGNLL